MHAHHVRHDRVRPRHVPIPSAALVVPRAHEPPGRKQEALPPLRHQLQHCLRVRHANL